jgi:hypothetical protein
LPWDQLLFCLAGLVGLSTMNRVKDRDHAIDNAAGELHSPGMALADD